MAQTEIAATLEGLMDQATVPHDARWKVRRAEIRALLQTRFGSSSALGRTALMAVLSRRQWLSMGNGKTMPQSAILQAVGALRRGSGRPFHWDEPADIRGMLNAKPEEIKWLAIDRLQLGRAALITGIGGSSKTRALYHLGIGSIIRRLPWHWEITTPGRAVLVLTEDTQGDVHRTLWGMCHAMRLTPDELRPVAERLTVFPLAGKAAELLNFGKDRILRRTPAYIHLVERIRSIGDVVFVGLDPALGLSAGDEMTSTTSGCSARLPMI